MIHENSSDLKCKKNVGSSLVIGGSRGLGRSIAELFTSDIISRTQGIKLDLSKEDAVEPVVEQVQSKAYGLVVYAAGGGVHGEFFSKPFRAHKWTYAVNFLTPVALVNRLIASGYQGDFVYIGSTIAERSCSAKSLSYSQSKKMAKEVFLNLSPSSGFEVRVFSPPYMNTGLLPKKSWPREEYPQLVLETGEVAKVFRDWLLACPSGDVHYRHFDWIKNFPYDLPQDREI